MSGTLANSLMIDLLFRAENDSELKKLQELHPFAKNDILIQKPRRHIVERYKKHLGFFIMLSSKPIDIKTAKPGVLERYLSEILSPASRDLIAGLNCTKELLISYYFDDRLCVTELSSEWLANLGMMGFQLVIDGELLTDTKFLKNSDQV